MSKAGSKLEELRVQEEKLRNEMKILLDSRERKTKQI
jgi:hypothetical protein